MEPPRPAAVYLAKPSPLSRGANPGSPRIPVKRGPGAARAPPPPWALAWLLPRSPHRRSTYRAWPPGSARPSPQAPQWRAERIDPEARWRRWRERRDRRPPLLRRAWPAGGRRGGRRGTGSRGCWWRRRRTSSTRPPTGASRRSAAERGEGAWPGWTRAGIGWEKSGGRGYESFQGPLPQQVAPGLGWIPGPILPCPVTFSRLQPFPSRCLGGAGPPHPSLVDGWPADGPCSPEASRPEGWDLGD